MSDNKLNGLYLVVDLSMDYEVLLEKVEQALEGGVEILQIWNQWPNGMSEYDKEQLITYIIEMADKYDVPVLVNDDWELLQCTDLDGVHFDSKPDDFGRIREEVGRDFIAGVTCSNNLEVISWAEKNDFDYVSFCAMFPSPSVDSCEIVRPDTVRKARQITDMSLFLSGGITPGNIDELSELEFNGVAVISGILKDEMPQERALNYKQSLSNR